MIGLFVGLPAAIALIFLAKPVVASILDRILQLNSTLVYVVVGLLVFAEAALFFGFIFPGETAAILGGVIASQGRVNIVALCALVVLAAIIGDTVGYWVGHRYGERLLSMRLLTHRRGAIDQALELLRRRGALAVIIGRFTAFLRAVMPGLAGASKLRYGIFLAANAVGGIIWGISFTLLGYFLGSAYKRAEKYAGWASTGILIMLLVIGTVLFLRGRLRERAIELDFESTTDDPAKLLHDEILAVTEALEAEEDYEV